MLKAEQVVLKVVDRRVHVAGQLLQRHRRVELQVRPARRGSFAMSGGKILYDR